MNPRWSAQIWINCQLYLYLHSHTSFPLAEYFPHLWVATICHDEVFSSFLGNSHRLLYIEYRKIRDLVAELTCPISTITMPVFNENWLNIPTSLHMAPEGNYNPGLGSYWFFCRILIWWVIGYGWFLEVDKAVKFLKGRDCQSNHGHRSELIGAIRTIVHCKILLFIWCLVNSYLKVPLSIGIPWLNCHHDL